MRKFYLLFIISITFCGPVKDIERPSLLLTFLLGSQTQRIGVVSSDLGSSGRFGVMTEDGLSVPSIYSNIYSDAIARYQDGKVYIINRLGRDNIQVLDPHIGYSTVMEFSVGTKSNPQDFIKISNSKAYVSLYNKDQLLVVNPELGTFTGEIDLNSYTDSDGYPEAGQMVLHENRVYLAIQRLNRSNTQQNWPPADYSLLLEIDTVTDKVANEYKLQSTNPIFLKKVEIFGESHIVVNTPGYLGFNFKIDGGIEAFNLRTKALREGFIYSETTAGGDILDFVIKDDTVGYANVEYQDFSTSIQKFNPTTGEKLSELANFSSKNGYVSGMLLAPNGYLYLGDATFSNPGVMIYNTNQGDTKITPTPVSVGLRPIQLIYIP
ncbi:MAG: hypothetical protein H7A23_01915 [Leptospiraceae bacterium]|nr:hypothetical protein [Leptospiraceae bacterium]MCP5493287.1 hypothetical protein [Leptospiraceae bacterium]